jgi:hypothetical protein
MRPRKKWALRKEEKKERETGVSHLKYASVLDYNFKQKVTAQHKSAACGTEWTAF